MLTLPRLDVPLLPLLTGNDSFDLENVNSYLQSLVAYFYSCNVPLGDSVFGQGQGSARYNEGSFTFGTTGFTVPATGVASWVQVGRQVTLALPQLLTTSNSTGLTLTGIPANILASNPAYTVIPTLDNGAFVLGRIIADSITTWSVFPSNGTNLWTAAGVKGFQACVVSYLSV